MPEAAAASVAHAGRGRQAWSGLRRGLARPAAAVGRAYRRVRTQAVTLEPVRLESAVVARRPAALSLALLVFLVGFSVDDLRVLRLPGYLVGASLALLLILVGPLTMGRTFAQAWREEPSADFQARVGRVRRLGLLQLLGTAVVFVAWLIVFSAGVPPWAR